MLHAQLHQASGSNSFTFRLPVPSQLNIPAWRSRLASYPDMALCDFLEFGSPVGYANDATPFPQHKIMASRSPTQRSLTQCSTHSRTLSKPLPFSRMGKLLVVVDLFPARIFGQRWNSCRYLSQ